MVVLSEGEIKSKSMSKRKIRKNKLNNISLNFVWDFQKGLALPSLLETI